MKLWYDIATEKQIMEIERARRLSLLVLFWKVMLPDR